jgi:hypothetical protein
LRGGEVGEHLGEPPADVGFGGDDGRDEERAFVGVGTDEELFAVDAAGGELAGR